MKQTCSDDRLRSLLQCDEDSEEARSSALHVDQCPRCQLRLEELAAEPATWRIVKHSLLHGDDQAIEDGSTAQLAEGRKPSGQRIRTRWQRHPTAWTDSMARQLLSAPSHPEMLGRIGRYEVERLIGVGGMGVVFKAFDTELNRPVAVKVLAPYLAGSGAARKRFAREARAAAAVVHEHVVAIHNVETDGESPFLVMPYVAGESLQQRIDRNGALELCEILRIAMQTASGLAAAHAQGLVHRDVKPSNILLEQGIERTLLTDFGLARASDDASLTHTGYHPGTPQYMSPEQARGDAVDARSDLFSLGSVIYTMCTGRPPFRAETNYGVLRRITDNEPRRIREVNPAIPEWLEGIVNKLLAKDVSQRFQSAQEIAQLLEQCLAHVQQPTAVALPPDCRHSNSGRARALRSWSWLIGATPEGLRPFASWGRRIVGLVAAGAMISFAAFVLQNFTARREPFNDTKSAAMTTESTPEGSRPAADFAWGANDSDISGFSRDLVPLESRSQQLWDKSPAMDKE
ncbi:MAG: serine/threonine-protein kinase [Planctomycetaceae bacterium]